jgi:hypothetical protein
MTSLTYAFNGDADGLCALQQLRLAGAPADEQFAVLVTGVKRDIALVDRVRGQSGDACTVLDVSFDVNRAGVLSLLGAGARVRYFDHHFAGEVPQHANLEVYIDPSPTLCTSLIVNRYLGKRLGAWAVVGAFGDSLVDEGRVAAQATGLDPAAADQLQQLGLALNYNAYGESIADLHVPPSELAQEMLPFANPLDFVATSPTYRRVADGFREDMALAHGIQPLRQAPGAILFVLPDAPWARRASGTLANDLAKAHSGSAVAIVSRKTGGDYLVSVRVPRDSAVSAESFCRRFPTGGGRRTAAGINHLPSSELDVFAGAFEVQFRTP